VNAVTSVVLLAFPL